MNLPYPSRQKVLFTLVIIGIALVVVGIGFMLAAVSTHPATPPVPKPGSQIDEVSTQAYANAACEFMAMKTLSFHPRDPKISIQANYEAVVYCFEPETNLTARSLIPLIKK